jgi:hypothetical protein
MMVARIELITVVRCQVYCDEEHKSLGVFNAERDATKAKDRHNETCESIVVTPPEHTE